MSFAHAGRASFFHVVIVVETIVERPTREGSV